MLDVKVAKRILDATPSIRGERLGVRVVFDRPEKPQTSLGRINSKAMIRYGMSFSARRMAQVAAAGMKSIRSRQAPPIMGERLKGMTGLCSPHLAV